MGVFKDSVADVITTLQKITKVDGFKSIKEIVKDSLDNEQC